MGGHEDEEGGQRAEGVEPALEGDAGQAADEPRRTARTGIEVADDAPELGEVGARPGHQADDGDGGEHPARGSMVTSPSPSRPVAR